MTQSVLKCDWHQTAHIFETYINFPSDGIYGNSISETANLIIRWIEGMIPAMIFEQKYFQDNVDRAAEVELAARLFYHYCTEESVRTYLKIKWAF